MSSKYPFFKEKYLIHNIQFNNNGIAIPMQYPESNRYHISFPEPLITQLLKAYAPAPSLEIAKKRMEAFKFIDTLEDLFQGFSFILGPRLCTIHKIDFNVQNRGHWFCEDLVEYKQNCVENLTDILNHLKSTTCLLNHFTEADPSVNLVAEIVAKCPELVEVKSYLNGRSCGTNAQQFFLKERWLTAGFKNNTYNIGLVDENHDANQVMIILPEMKRYIEAISYSINSNFWQNF